MPKLTLAKPSSAAAMVDAPPDLVAKALRELGLNQPFYTCRVIGNRLEFHLYGGSIVTWPPVGAGSPRPSSRPTRVPSGPGGK